MNRAELYAPDSWHPPGSWRPRALPVAVSFNAAQPKNQVAAAQRVARAAQRGDLHMSARIPADAFFAERARILAQCAHNPSRVLPQPKVSRGPRETRKAPTKAYTPPVVRVPIAARAELAPPAPGTPLRTRLSFQDVQTCLDACTDAEGQSNMQIARALNAEPAAVGSRLFNLVKQGRAWFTGERRERRYHAAR